MYCVRARSCLYYLTSFLKAETKGRLYRHIAAEFAVSNAVTTHFRSDTDTATSIAVCPPYVYTVSKDITLVKWELPTPSPQHKSSRPKKAPKRAPPPKARRPKKLLSTKGNRKKASDSSYKHHIAPILTVAASSSGKFVATGGVDKRLIVWSAADLTPLRVFTQHRDAVTSLAFRRGTNQLYSASRDRTIKTWSLDELAYVETLFGHQDEVVDVAALAREQCISVGARDRTARLWKVVEETQLVFRGGGGGGGGSEKRRQQSRDNIKEGEPSLQSYLEGSIDRVALIDEETFVTGSDNGALSLWTMHKKKPVFIVRAAHGLDPPLKPEEVFAEAKPDQKVPGEPQPRWITALATIPYSDLILSGSWDGEVRVWRVSEDKRKIEALGTVGEAGVKATANSILATTEANTKIRGVINDIDVFERGDRGKDGICIVVATGREHRLGRWKMVEGKNGALVIEIPRLPGEKSDRHGHENGQLDEVAA
jgi:ribosomal RNA-processing protein 9